MSLNKRRLISSILCIIFVLCLFAGCSPDSSTDNTESNSNDSSANDTTSLNGEAFSGTDDDDFTLVYSPDSSFNPYTSDNNFNLQISGLLYEGLFALDENLNVQNVLCDSFSTDDGINYIFTLKSGIKFWNGSDFTAYDVAYSLNIARYSKVYSSRLSCISSVAAMDDLTLSITLNRENQSLASLLDVPIVEYDTGYSSIPGGTGPYTTSGEGASFCLAINTLYRNASQLPVETIFLYPYSGGDDLVSAFMVGDVDLVVSDETDPLAPVYSGSAEKTSYNTTSMHYIGFNTSGGFFSNSDFRSIFSLSIDREYISQNIMNGYAVASSVPINPSSSFYESSVSKNYGYSAGRFAESLKAYGFKDTNGDGFIEYPSFGKYESFSLDFIVNEDDAAKVEAAEYIAAALSQEGIDVVLSILPWEDYLEKLSDGDFDMYYGDIRLTGDFDLSCLLAFDGNANYGVSDCEEYENHISEFLAASDGYEKEAAVMKLCKYIGDNAPIVPILFEKQCVITHWGDIKDFSPTQSTLFYNITGWTYK